MNLEKKQLAKNLFFQTELTKTQIANMLGVSRRSITYWIKEGDWLRLKTSATHLPSLLAETCYHMIGHLTDAYLSERRLTNPVSHKEIDGLYKLTLTIGKLKNRSTLNESMEMFGFFLDGLRRKKPDLAVELTPFIEEYIESRAAVYTNDAMPEHFTGIGGRIPWIEKDKTEEHIDDREAFFSDPDIIKAYTEAGIPLPSDEEICTLPHSEEQPKEDRQEHYDRMNRERLTLRQEREQMRSEETDAVQTNAATDTPAPQNSTEPEVNIETLADTLEALQLSLWEEVKESILTDEKTKQLFTA